MSRNSARDAWTWNEVLQGINAVGQMMDSDRARVKQIEADNEQAAFNEAYQGMLDEYNNNGGNLDAISSSPYTRTKTGVRAYAALAGDLGNTREAQLKAQETAIKRANQSYETFRPQAYALNEAYKRGDSRSFDDIAVTMSSQLPLPYRLVPTSEGAYGVQFRSDDKLGWADTGEVWTREDVLKNVNGLLQGETTVLRGQDMGLSHENSLFMGSALNYQGATRAGNFENMSNPDKELIINGGEMTAIVLNDPNDYTLSPEAILFDKAGNTIGKVSADDFQRLGLKVTGRGRGKASSGASGGIGNRGFDDLLGLKGALHSAITQKGYLWDKDTGYYYMPQDAGITGEQGVDYSAPLDEDMLFMIMEQNGYGDRVPSNRPLPVHGMKDQNGRVGYNKPIAHALQTGQALK